MPGPIVQLGATALCAHAGQVQFVPSSPRVQVGGAPVITQADAAMVAGCTFPAMSSGAPPCTTVQWLTAATRVLANGVPVLVQSATGLGLPPGQPVTIVAVQPRVIAQ